MCRVAAPWRGPWSPGSFSSRVPSLCRCRGAGASLTEKRGVARNLSVSPKLTLSLSDGPSLGLHYATRIAIREGLRGIHCRLEPGGRSVHEMMVWSERIHPKPQEDSDFEFPLVGVWDPLEPGSRGFRRIRSGVVAPSSIGGESLQPRLDAEREMARAACAPPQWKPSCSTPAWMPTPSTPTSAWLASTRMGSIDDQTPRRIRSRCARRSGGWRPRRPLASFLGT